jgi:radical SAM superfamily enzyme YgiQ (UPF0313 family)
MKITLVLHKYNVPLGDPCCYALGYMYVSAEYKHLGYDVKILNYNLYDYDFEKEIEGQDLVGFTGFEEFLPCIKRDAAICREMGIKTILGGGLATFRKEEMEGIADIVYPGEFEDGNLLPDYEGFGIEEYHKRHGWKYMGVLTSRGCPYSCTFCAQTCKFSLRPLESVFAEIDLYRQKYGVESIIFNDNTFNISKARYLAICKGMRERGLSWDAAIRCDNFDEEMAKASKDSGASYFVVGVESFNQAKLDRMNKQLKVEDIHSCLDLLHKYQIDYHGNILLGFEDESAEDIISEICGVPKGYKLFPTMVQPFVGTKNGKTRKIDQDTYNRFDTFFRDYIVRQGKYCYPELAVT